MNKRSKRGFVDALIIVAGGIGGGALGWYVAQESLAQYAAKARVHLSADNRGPVIMGYVFFGGVVGLLAAFALDEVWRRIRSPRERSQGDET